MLPLSSFLHRRARPHCSRRFLALGLTCLLALLLAGPTAPAAPAPDPLTPLNAIRADDALPPLRPAAALDRLAQAYAEQMAVARCTCPPGAEDDGRRLARDVAAALGPARGVRELGLAIAWGRTRDEALAIAAGDPANAALVRDRRMQLAGVGTAVVLPGPPWLVPPPGGGPDIDVTGYTILVLVTVGNQS